MVADSLATEAYRPNGTSFGGYAYSTNAPALGVQRYGTYSFGNNGYGPYGSYGPYGTTPIGGAMLAGCTRTTTYASASNDEAEEETLKGHVEDLKFILDKEWDEDKFAEQWLEFKKAYKESAEFQARINNKKIEYMSAGKDEQTAEKLANRYGESIIFDSLKSAFNRYSGSDLKQSIFSHFWWDSNYQKYLKKLQNS